MKKISHFSVTDDFAIGVLVPYFYFDVRGDEVRCIPKKGKLYFETTYKSLPSDYDAHERTNVFVLKVDKKVFCIQVEHSDFPNIDLYEDNPSVIKV